MIPGTVFMSLLAGALFGVVKGMALVVSTATAGASSCYFLSKLIGRPLLFSLWPDKLVFFQDQVWKTKQINLLALFLMEIFEEILKSLGWFVVLGCEKKRSVAELYVVLETNTNIA